MASANGANNSEPSRARLQRQDALNSEADEPLEKFITVLQEHVVEITIAEDEEPFRKGDEIKKAILGNNYVLKSLRKLKEETPEASTNRDAEASASRSGEDSIQDVGFSSPTACIDKIDKVTEVEMSFNTKEPGQAILTIEDLHQGKYYQGVGEGGVSENFSELLLNLRPDEQVNLVDPPNEQVEKQAKFLQEALTNPSQRPKILFVSNERLMLKHEETLLEFEPKLNPHVTSSPDLTSNSGAVGGATCEEEVTPCWEGEIKILGDCWLNTASYKKDTKHLLVNLING